MTPAWLQLEYLTLGVERLSGEFGISCLLLYRDHYFGGKSLTAWQCRHRVGHLLQVPCRPADA
jgi:hypothetical protein